jgi:prepilin-type N-terminal cleavage/methylation domain-containing protein
MTRSRFSANAKPHARRRRAALATLRPAAGLPDRAAFTLIELLLVVGLVAIVAAGAVSALAASSPARGELAVVRQLHADLLTARVEAMRSGEHRAVNVRTNATAERRNAEPQGGEPALVLVHRDTEPASTATVSFDATGRTATRLLAFTTLAVDTAPLIRAGLLSPDTFLPPTPSDTPPQRGAGPLAPTNATDNTTSLPNTDRLLQAGRLWLVTFHPVSGEPALMGLGRGVPSRLQPPGYVTEGMPAR